MTMFRRRTQNIPVAACRECMRLARTSTPATILTRQLMRAVTVLNFRLRIDAGCSIFIVPLWSSPSRIFSYGRYHRISTRTFGSWCSFWTSDEALESEDEALHLRAAQSDLHHQFG